MGAARQAAEAVAAALENHDVQRARTFLADDFTFNDPSSPRGPMSADEWMAANANLYRAFPDFSYNFEFLREEGNQAWVRSHMEGTHSNDWDLSRMGMGTIPASGRSVSTGESVSRGTVNSEGKVQKIEVVEQSDGGGIMGVLQQIGVDLG